MSNVGAELKKAREAADKTRAQVARDTGILIHQLAALEYGNWDSLPDDETVAGYVRKYAEYLGFVPDQPVAEFWAERRAEASSAPGDAPRGDAAPAARETGSALPGVPGPSEPGVGDASPLAAGAGAAAASAADRAKRGDAGGAALDAGAVHDAGAVTDAGVSESALARWATGPRLLGAFAITLVLIVVVGWILLLNRGGGNPRVESEVPAPPTGSEPAPLEDSSPEPERPGEDVAVATPTRPSTSEPTRAPDSSDPSTEVATEAPTRIPPQLETPARSSARAPATTPPPEPTLSSAQTRAPAGEATLSVSEHGVGTGIRDRTLIGRADRFREGAQVVFWTRVEGGRAGDTVHHVWLREDREVDDIPLRIGSAHWRTQSRKTLYEGSAGRWAVEARDSDGRVLARSEFTCGD